MQCVARQRNRAPLPGGAEHDEVGGQVVGEERLRDRLGVEEDVVARTRRAIDGRPRCVHVRVLPMPG